MKIEWTINFGNLLTIISILVSVAGLIWTWRQYILTQERQQAAEVRKAAAVTLSNLERLGQLADLLFAELQPIIVATTEILEENRNPESTRDYFWKTVANVRLSQRKRVLEEKIEGAYVALYSYVTDARQLFQSAIADFRSSEAAAIQCILDRCQKEILLFDQNAYQAATLGNKCRVIVREECDKYDKKSTDILSPIKKRLEHIVLMQDRQIIICLNKRKL